MPYNTAYDIHRSRVMLEKINRESLFNQNMPSSSISRGLKSKLSNLDISVNNIGYSLQDIKYSMEEGMRLNAKATANAIQYLGDQFNYGIKEVSSQISGLQEITVKGFDQVSEILSYGMSEIVWHLEQSNKVLTNILATLKAPRKTEADELRIRGNELFKNGLNARFDEDRQKWMKLSLEAYKECIEKNPVDFSAFQSSGIIHFFELKNHEEAIKSFRSAASFAEPYSKYYAAISWLHLSYVYRCLKEYAKAFEVVSQALQLKNDWAEVNFQYAVYSGMIGKHDNLKTHLVESIKQNQNYWFRATTEPDLIPLRGKVENALEELRNETVTIANRQFNQVLTTFNQVEKVFHLFKELNITCTNSISVRNDLSHILNKIKILISEETYFEAKKALVKIEGFKILLKKELLKRIKEEAEKDISRQEDEIISKYYNKIHDLEKPVKEKVYKEIDRLKSMQNKVDKKRMEKQPYTEALQTGAGFGIIITFIGWFIEGYRGFFDIGVGRGFDIILSFIVGSIFSVVTITLVSFIIWLLFHFILKISSESSSNQLTQLNKKIEKPLESSVYSQIEKEKQNELDLIKKKQSRLETSFTELYGQVSVEAMSIPHCSQPNPTGGQRTWTEEAVFLFHSGKKIQAIQVIREATDLSLSEAKALVESWEK